MKKYIILFILLAISTTAFSQRFSPEIMWKLGRISEASLSPDGKQIIFGTAFYNLEKNKGNRDIFIITAEGGTPVRITDSQFSEYNAIWRPDGKKIGFLSPESGEMQIWEMNPDGSGKTQITKIPGGINGFKYSPDMKSIVYMADVKLDKTANEMYPDLPLANVIITDDLMYRHWDSWHDFAYSHVFYLTYNDGKTGTPVDLLEGERFDAPDQPGGGIEQFNISSDGKKIAYVCKKLTGRDYTKSTNTDIYVYDVDTKETVNITEGNPGYDLDPVFSPDGTKLAYQSMKTAGFESDKKRLMVYDFQAGSSKDYSENFDQSSTNFNWSVDSKNIYFISGINATYQIFVLGIETGAIKQITTGRHDYNEISFENGVLIGSKVSMLMPAEIYRIDENSGQETQLTYVNKDVLSTFKSASVEERWVKTTDGKQMLVWVIYPPDFDPNKKYPALLYCQGGPQSAVSQFFSYRWNFQMMAANDYIIVAPNRRGLPTFGQEWNDQISKDYGGQNMNDYFSAIDSISNLPFINKEKLGAIGASYGGFSVYWLAGNHNKRFKAFIAHCGMFNFESWYGSTEEMWFANYDLGGAYWEKPVPKSYDFSPHRFVGNWDTPILVIHGMNDFRIPYTEGMQAYHAAQLQGIPSRFMLFPDETHFVSKPQNAVLWQREFFRFLDEYLK